MASGYALPAAGSYHVHSPSYSDIHRSPGKAAPNAFMNSNGSASASPLFTHAESSCESSPVPNANGHHTHTHSLEHKPRAFKENGYLSTHKHSYSSPPMKSRPRGESDLGRPANSKSSVYKPTLESIPAVLHILCQLRSFTRTQIHLLPFSST